jgi:hypothetical protein
MAASTVEVIDEDNSRGEPFAPQLDTRTQAVDHIERTGRVSSTGPFQPG